MPLPAKAPAPYGKRSTPGWTQKAVLLKEQSVMWPWPGLRPAATKTDFSDLMEARLEARLAAS